MTVFEKLRTHWAQAVEGETHYSTQKIQTLKEEKVSALLGHVFASGNFWES
jgi:hypothetical protein